MLFAAITQLSDLAGTRVAYPIGSAYRELSEPFVADVDWKGYGDVSSCFQAVLSDKVEATIVAEPVAQLAVAKYPEELVIADVVAQDRCGFGFRKDSLVAPQASVLIQDWRVMGELEKLKEKWCVQKPELNTLHPQTGTGENGVLKLGVVAELAPMAFMGRGNKIMGFDVDLAQMIANELNMTLKAVKIPLKTIIEALNMGHVDIICGAFSITADRAEAVQFTAPYYVGGLAVLVHKKNHQVKSPPTYLKETWASFQRTFIREARWKLIIKGLGKTLTVTLWAILFGSVIAVGLCALFRSRRIWAQVLARGYYTFFHGTPVLIVLMLLYYVLFARYGMSGLFAAILGFALVFAANVGQIWANALRAIPDSQREAAKALGFRAWGSFYLVILPQLIRRTLRLYRGAVISTLKATSIVTTITVCDLTATCTIIRTRTYDAFFPLFTAAFIYYCLAKLITKLFDTIEARL